ncbi:regulatory protein [Salsuginibacillus halophilus]|uniref:Regulatory protein RecX n=1 Tax=Salsuginibacillus halophilus TaxID=517424 RepID=A0A2P8HBP6_9BACI|nr:RecX family transcriptional regulator [Salsuginibacillus halophilus]PSL43643.1 regulatory protein [Salsuginibacillus halophilus]
MYKITKITPQEQEERYNVFIDDGDGERFGIGVDEAVLVKWQLRRGLTLSAEEWQQLERDETDRKAVNAAFRYVASQLRTEAEVKAYLENKEYTAIAEALNVLKHYGYINDQAYAEAFVRTKMRTTDHGPQRIHKDLAYKGVASNVAEQALMLFTHEDQLEVAAKIVTKQMQKHTGSARMIEQKIVEALQRKGFAQALIQEVLRLYYEPPDESVEWQALQQEAERKYERFLRTEPPEKAKQKLQAYLSRRGYQASAVRAYIKELDSIEGGTN